MFELCFPMAWRILVEQGVANIGKNENIFFSLGWFDNSSIFVVVVFFGFGESSYCT